MIMGKNGSLFHQLISQEGLFLRKNGNEVSFCTRKCYYRFLRYAAEYFKGRGIRRIEQLDKAAVQMYADECIAQGKSAATVHTYLAPLCKALNIPMQEIRKEKRVCSVYKRSRSSRDPYAHASMEQMPKAVALSKCVGIRKRELKQLRGGDFRQINGHACVVVRRGKGGKAHEQRVLPHYMSTVQAMFENVPAEEKIFGADLKKGYDYHAQRRGLAQQAYAFYYARCQADPAYRETLYKEIAEYWHRANRKNREKLEPRSFFDKPYILRGDNRKKAIALGKAYVLDRLCLRTVSVFHLSHWRDDVSVGSYY